MVTACSSSEAQTASVGTTSTTASTTAEPTTAPDNATASETPEDASSTESSQPQETQSENVNEGHSLYDPNPIDAQAVALGETYYSNCGQAEAALALPLHEGQPGYRPALDRDGDGIACEPENWTEPGVWPSPTQVPKAFGMEDLERLKNDPTIDYDPNEYPGYNPEYDY